AAVKAVTKVGGCCKGFHIGCKLLQRLHVDVKAATLLRRLECC
ncbi:hypothetical protein Tco_1367077, partial [Tanacetum coccineum]